MIFLVLLLMVWFGGPFLVLGCAFWGLAPLFEREREPPPGALPAAQVTPRWWRRRAGRHRLTWPQRVRVTIGCVAAVLGVGFLQAVMQA